MRQEKEGVKLCHLFCSHVTPFLSFFPVSTFQYLAFRFGDFFLLVLRLLPSLAPYSTEKYDRPGTCVSVLLWSSVVIERTHKDAGVYKPDRMTVNVSMSADKMSAAFSLFYNFMLHSLLLLMMLYCVVIQCENR